MLWRNPLHPVEKPLSHAGSCVLSPFHACQPANVQTSPDQCKQYTRSHAAHMAATAAFKMVLRDGHTNKRHPAVRERQRTHWTGEALTHSKHNHGTSPAIERSKQSKLERPSSMCCAPPKSLMNHKCTGRLGTRATTSKHKQNMRAYVTQLSLHAERTETYVLNCNAQL
jgi:hypothetical protein